MSDAPPFPCPTRRWHTKAQPSGDPTRPEVSAKGKSVIITGGGTTGIGGETARYYAAAGASRIALLGRREGPLLDNRAFIESEYPGVEVVTIPTDVTIRADVEGAFSRFARDGKIDVLVHTAAVVGPKPPVAEVDGDEFLAALHTNISGTFCVAQSFVRHAAPDAVAVNVNSWSAHLSLGNAWSSYAVAKAATWRLWDTVAIANPDMSIFHTHPGVILTEMTLNVPGGAEEFKDIKADDVSLPASFNLWLASSEARFLKGKYLWCNWDIEELKNRAEELQAGTELSIGLVGWPWAKR